jgi:hypothetical protein
LFYIIAVGIVAIIIVLAIKFNKNFMEDRVYKNRFFYTASDVFEFRGQAGCYLQELAAQGLKSDYAIDEYYTDNDFERFRARFNDCREMGGNDSQALDFASKLGL